MSNKELENIKDDMDNVNEELENTAVDNNEIIVDEDMVEEDIEFDEGSSMSLHSYVNLSDKYSDVLSSATTMLFVGGAGIVFLICLKAGLLPINLGETAWLFYTVMGLVFVAFIIAGISSYNNALDLKEAASKENETIEEIKKWASEHITIEELDKDLDLNDSIEELFFVRYDTIKDMLMHEFETIDEPLIAEISEQIYHDLYEDENTEFTAYEDELVDGDDVQTDSDIETNTDEADESETEVDSEDESTSDIESDN